MQLTNKPQPIIAQYKKKPGIHKLNQKIILNILLTLIDL